MAPVHERRPTKDEVLRELAPVLSQLVDRYKNAPVTARSTGRAAGGGASAALSTGDEAA